MLYIYYIFHLIYIWNYDYFFNFKDENTYTFITSFVIQEFTEVVFIYVLTIHLIFLVYMCFYTFFPFINIIVN